MILAESDGHTYHLLNLTYDELRIAHQSLREYPESPSEPNTFEKRLSRKLAKYLGERFERWGKDARERANQCRRSTDSKTRELMERLEGIE